ncbi:MAG: HAMP domain-containing histidine kinase [Oscillospiraceae bacterium]|nr:HAMP domain-containing histidine kinase [Oscillospiraceae bacterium]
MKLLKRPYIWVIPAVVFFVFAFALVCRLNGNFGYYANKYFRLRFYGTSIALPLVGVAVSFIAFGAVFWQNAGAQMNKPLHRFRYARLCLIAAAYGGLCVYLLFEYNSPPLMLLIPATVTAAALTLWATTVVRLRSATLRELETLSESYRLANEEKLKAERFKTELIANVSHDIRTPLTSIINYVDFIDKLGIENEQLGEYVAVLKKTSERLKTLTGDLLDASKAGTGNVVMNIQTLDLAELLGQTAGEFDAAFAEKELTYIARHGDGKILVAADGTHLWRVLANLFGNAAKYAMPSTRVYAEITTSGNEASLSIKNVSERQLDVLPEMLTERFVQGDRARNAEGNGLGLYIAKHLTEYMGGKLTVRISGDLFEAVVTLPQAENLG